ncbi:unnamed protein product, partial [Owenia fusiformis]
TSGLKNILKMPFPLIKLAALAIKQIAKPMANIMKRRAKSSPFFRKYVCMPPAQLYHQWDTNMKVRILGLGKPKDVKPLNEEMATDLGADLLGESILFIVGGGLITYEYWRSNRNEQRKENKQNYKLDELDIKVQEMGILIEEQDTKIRELTRLVHSVGKSQSITEKIVKIVKNVDET